MLFIFSYTPGLDSGLHSEAVLFFVGFHQLYFRNDDLSSKWSMGQQKKRNDCDGQTPPRRIAFYFSLLLKNFYLLLIKSVKSSDD